MIARKDHDLVWNHECKIINMYIYTNLLAINGYHDYFDSPKIIHLII